MGNFFYHKEFREIKLRWDLTNDLPQFKPIYNVSPGRKDADVLAIVRGERGNEGRLMYWPLIPSSPPDAGGQSGGDCNQH